MAKYNYFVSFSFLKDAQSGYGNSPCDLPEEITSMEHVEAIANKLCSHFDFDVCVVLNYQLLKKED